MDGTHGSTYEKPAPSKKAKEFGRTTTEVVDDDTNLLQDGDEEDDDYVHV